jgi:hypothetical protein
VIPDLFEDAPTMPGVTEDDIVRIDVSPDMFRELSDLLEDRGRLLNGRTD